MLVLKSCLRVISPRFFSHFQNPSNSVNSVPTLSLSLALLTEQGRVASLISTSMILVIIEYQLHNMFWTKEIFGGLAWGSITKYQRGDEFILYQKRLFVSRYPLILPWIPIFSHVADIFRRIHQKQATSYIVAPEVDLQVMNPRNQRGAIFS